MITSISWQDPRRQEFQETIDTNTANIEQYNNLIEGYKKNLIDAEQASLFVSKGAEYTQNLILEQSDLNINDECIQRYLNAASNLIADDIHTINRRLQSNQEHLRNVRAAVALANERLSNISAETKTVNLVDIRIALKKLGSCVNPRQIKLLEPHSICFVFNGLTYKVMEIDRDNFPRILSPYEYITIPLAPIKVTINPSTGYITIEESKRKYKIYKWGNKTRAHPHVLTNDEPCLGDFLSPYREALEAQDWVTTFSLIKLFLERAINTDVAGQQWINYFVNNYAEGTNYTTEFFRFKKDNFVHNYKAVEQENPGVYIFEGYTNDGSTRVPEVDFPHPYNDFVVTQ